MSTLEAFIQAVVLTLAITLIASIVVRFLASLYQKLP
jgi:hypothetical protein